MTKISSAHSFSRSMGRLTQPIKQVSERDYFVDFSLPFYHSWTPGQFLMLQWGAHIIGRPFAILDWNKVSSTESVLKLWFRVLGQGTKDLAAFLKSNSEVHLTLPLGKVPAELTQSSRLLFISGGVGAASVWPMIIERSRLGHEDFWVHGERDLGSLAAGLDPDLVYIEDVAGAHKKGRVTTLFEDPLALAPHKLDDFDALVCCGPSPMLQALQKFSANLNKVCYLGLEEKMACGLGLCFSCSVKTDVGMQRCCLEGPWFNSKSLLNHFEFRQGLLPK